MKSGIILSLFMALSMVSVPAMAWDYLTFDNGDITVPRGPESPDRDQDKDQDKDQDHDRNQDRQKDKDHDKNQDHQKQDCRKRKHDGQDACRAGNRVEKFSVVCYYKNDKNPDKYQNCKAAATFAKFVTPEGGEVADESPKGVEPGNPFLPVFDVECEHQPRYTDSAFRVTDLLSTRIIGTTGPHPSIYLPRGSLTVGEHVTDSYLEIADSNTFYRLGGRCYVWNN